MKVSIWWFAFGYFAFYVPYSALTKALSAGQMPDQTAPISGTALLPWSVIASVLTMLAFLGGMRWFRYLPRRRVLGLNLPVPGKWQFLSGLCTAAVVMTTTLAYTFEGVSIVLTLLLLRGGVLIMAPLVDAISGRKTRWFSWGGLFLSMAAVLTALGDRAGYDMTLPFVINVAVYLGAYFVRFRFMSKLAKTSDPEVTKSYFAQEQFVATPVLLLGLAVLALFGSVPEGMTIAQAATGMPVLGASGELLVPAADFVTQLYAGFVAMPETGFLWVVVLIGVFSGFTGIFGSLIFLDPRENTYCVPVNRCSSIVSGLVASLALWWFLDRALPGTGQLVGSVLVLGAILLLSIPPLLEKRRPH